VAECPLHSTSLTDAETVLSQPLFDEAQDGPEAVEGPIAGSEVGGIAGFTSRRVVLIANVGCRELPSRWSGWIGQIDRRCLDAQKIEQNYGNRELRVGFLFKRVDGAEIAGRSRKFRAGIPGESGRL
jgi:hypothetical protein